MLCSWIENDFNGMDFTGEDMNGDAVLQDIILPTVNETVEKRVNKNEGTISGSIKDSTQSIRLGLLMIFSQTFRRSALKVWAGYFTRRSEIIGFHDFNLRTAILTGCLHPWNMLMVVQVFRYNVQSILMTVQVCRYSVTVYDTERL